MANHRFLDHSLTLQVEIKSKLFVESKPTAWERGMKALGKVGACLSIVGSILKKEPTLQIVAEASDGEDALWKAEKLHPDLILLDVGLPKLNGLAVARRIGNVSPESKLLFLSQETSAELVKEALNLGACGYVAKANVVGELLEAVNSVLQGKRFLSSGLAGNSP